jgi:hypothetical protein
MNESRAQLTLIPGRKRMPVTVDAFRSLPQGPQATLFPESRPGVVVFVCFPDVEEEEFISLLADARPSYVIDLRIVPRFNVGRLNRERVFDLFDSVNTRYLDLTGILLNGASRADVMRSFSDLLSSGTFNLFRPVVFLLSRPETSVATDAEILDALSASGKEAQEVVQVPAWLKS